MITLLQYPPMSKLAFIGGFCVQTTFLRKQDRMAQKEHEGCLRNLNRECDTQSHQRTYKKRVQ